MSASKPAPSLEVLQRFLLGQLSENEVIAVEEYLRGCGDHLTVLDSLKGQDTLIDLLRAGEPASPVERQLLARRIDQLKRLRSAHPTVSFQGCEQPTPPNAEELRTSTEQLQELLA